MHLDLEADNVEAQVKRLEKLGAIRWAHQEERGFDFWVMGDPWDSESAFCRPSFPNS
jgi:Glyoxalase-like domain